MADNAIKNFLKLESAGGIVLFAAALLAMICENTFLAPTYDLLLQTPVEVRVGALHIAKPFILWIDDGLMAIFFLLIGLEVKREFLDGELSSLAKIALPGIAAIGGMVVPALLYLVASSGDPNAAVGWAIPCATDIAFALGVLSLFGQRVPISLKIFLMALAIFDDLGAIVIIAIFYTNDLSLAALCGAMIFLTGLFVLNRLRIASMTPFVLLGLALWICVLKSGVHATLAGVALAFAIPYLDKSGKESPLKHLEHSLHPWVAFGVLPLFAFGNAGINLLDLSVESLIEPMSLGIILGLVLGKLAGVFGFSYIAIRSGVAKLPDGVTIKMIFGVSGLTGIGFTMSLFIGGLAFPDPEQLSSARIAIVLASILAGAVGVCVLRFALPANEK